MNSMCVVTALTAVGILLSQAAAITIAVPNGCCTPVPTPIPTPILPPAPVTYAARRLLQTTTTSTGPCTPPVSSGPTAGTCPSGSLGLIPGTTLSNSVCTNGQCMTTVTAAVRADPVLTGFDNSTFEFFGQPGYNYSLLSTPTLAVNMQLVEAGPEHIRHQDGEGTFAGSMAVVLPALSLIGVVDKAGNMTLAVNGVDVDIEQPHDWEQVSYEPYVPGLGQVITVTQPPFTITLVAVKQYVDVESGYSRGHFDMAADLAGPIVTSVSGVLGQTFSHMSSELVEADFEVPELACNSHLESIPTVSRRLLAISDQGQFPLYASLTAEAA